MTKRDFLEQFTGYMNQYLNEAPTGKMPSRAEVLNNEREWIGSHIKGNKSSHRNLPFLKNDLVNNDRVSSALGHSPSPESNAKLSGARELRDRDSSPRFSGNKTERQHGRGIRLPPEHKSFIKVDETSNK